MDFIEQPQDQSAMTRYCVCYESVRFSYESSIYTTILVLTNVRNFSELDYWPYYWNNMINGTGKYTLIAIAKVLILLEILPDGEQTTHFQQFNLKISVL